MVVLGFQFSAQGIISSVLLGIWAVGMFTTVDVNNKTAYSTYSCSQLIYQSSS